MAPLPVATAPGGGVSGRWPTGQGRGVAVDPRDGSEVAGAASSGLRRPLVVAVLLASFLGCGQGDDGTPEPRVPPTAEGENTTTTSTTVATTTTTTTEPTPTTTLPPTTAAPTTTPPTSTAPASGPGDPCDPAGGDPDCTDQTNDGQYRIIEGFADCLAEFGGDVGICLDLDGDGYATYPDSG